MLQFIHPGLKIPGDLSAALLPDPRISILDLLKYPFPTISVATPKTPTLELFISQAEPDSIEQLDEAVRRIPIPPVAVVLALGKACKAGLGFRSVACPHAPWIKESNLPIWVITYWTEVVTICGKWREPWLRAETSLHQRRRTWKKGASDLVTDVFSALSTMPWHGDVKGFTNPEPISSLA